jgi:hypothetical protein
VIAEITLSYLMHRGNEQGVVSVFLHSLQSVAILLNCLHLAAVKPRHGMTTGSEHSRAGHAQA